MTRRHLVMDIGRVLIEFINHIRVSRSRMDIDDIDVFNILVAYRTRGLQLHLDMSDGHLDNRACGDLRSN